MRSSVVTDLDGAQSLNDIMRVRQKMSFQEREEHYYRRAPYDAPEMEASRQREHALWWVRMKLQQAAEAREVDYADIEDGLTLDEGFAALAKIAQERKANQ